MLEYPKMIYHPERPRDGHIVQNEDEELALLETWGDSEAAGDDDDAKAELKAARDLYVEKFGKRPGPKWTVEQINEKIAEAAGDDD